MNTNLQTIIYLIIIISILEAIAQYCLKRGSNKYDIRCIFISGLLYIIISYLLYISYKYDTLSFINLSWSCISIILAYISGIIFFNEKFDIYKILALIFAICAIYLSYKSNNE